MWERGRDYMQLQLFPAVEVLQSAGVNIFHQAPTLRGIIILVFAHLLKRYNDFSFYYFEIAKKNQISEKKL